MEPQTTQKAYRKSETKATGSITATVTGAITERPVERQTRKGNPFATTKMQAGHQRVSVIAFDSDTVTALLALGVGEIVSVSGELQLKDWTDRQGQTRTGLDLVARGVPTRAQPTAQASVEKSATPSTPDFDDEIPF